LVMRTVDLIQEREVETFIQTKTEDLKTAYKLNKENCKIDWDLDLDRIYNKIRGLNPFPAAWCYLNTNDAQLTVKIFGIEKEVFAHNLDSGALDISKHELKVAVKGGYVIIKEIQLPGKRKMDIKSLLNGYDFSKNSKML
ncbi:MAG: methionyl-tRNA formyltransferase, partial [Psychroserpens sp.]